MHLLIGFVANRLLLLLPDSTFPAFHLLEVHISVYFICASKKNWHIFIQMYTADHFLDYFVHFLVLPDAFFPSVHYHCVLNC